MLFTRLVHSIRVGVFDAGSTGTRLKLFEFDKNTIVSQNLFRSEDMPSAGAGGKGLHQYSSKEVEHTIKQLLAQSRAQKSTLLGFYGTAGMRSVSSAKQSSVLDAVKAAAKDYSLVECKVITGNEEALYSLKGFEHLKPDEKDFSIIDMGGRSVQIIQRDGQEIRLSSLKMGILNSKCGEIDRDDSKSGLSNSLKRLLGMSSGLVLHEYAGPNEGIDVSSYVCKESRVAGGVWNFDCSPHANAFGDGIGSKKRSPRNVSVSRLESVASVDSYTATTAKKEMDLLNQASKLQEALESRDLGISPLLSEDHGFLASGVSNSKDILCIDEFLKSRPIGRLKASSRIYLMSFFEEILKPGGVTTLGHLLQDFGQKCPGQLGDDCLRLYYSIQFLKKLGVGQNSDMRLLNRIQGTDISWSLGKALELRDRALNLQVDRP